MGKIFKESSQSNIHEQPILIWNIFNVLLIMEMQIKTTVKSITLSPGHFKPSRLTIPKDGKDVEEPQLSHFSGNSVTCWTAITHTPEVKKNKPQALANVNEHVLQPQLSSIVGGLVTEYNQFGNLKLN